MSLGVLNNLNATYAANNLNNTSNSLSKTLQQLSSGSKINSGSDDAAGLSLVNGLQANQQALTQSSTNATEGVGLLQVADGALSQVTSLLNRAVTLATEVSNGTLTSSQQSAANQEYKSILNEVSNIGSTTTYNQQQVFGNTFNVYTGDSTTSGSSINSLNISSLSSSNLGDTKGAVSYSTAGSTYTFGAAAQQSDVLSTAPGNLSYTDSNGKTQTLALGLTSGTSTITNLEQAINSNTTVTGVTATWNSTTGALKLSSANGTATLTGSVVDKTGTKTEAYSFTAAAETDTLSSVPTALNYVDANGKSQTVSLAGLTANSSSIDNMITSINNTTSTSGVTASWDSTNKAIDLQSANGTATLTGTITDATGSITATNGAGTATTATASEQTAVAATMSYTASAGQDLSSTDLSSQTDAQAALTKLNSAITDVSAQDGYIGAQINTLNSVSSVISTQKTNIESAQNAVQATDYATASSNMSKYEILSQTGISALAQANSVQQEVTKLLQ
ncbi:MAG: flagellin [Terracidiphilus sp.]|nr:flagellin [Terracidiphilus sp.]